MASASRHRKRRKLKSEINVVPYIDVMLVLLIIFMVAAPLATVDVNVDLPVSNAPASGRPAWLLQPPSAANAAASSQASRGREPRPWAPGRESAVGVVAGLIS